MPRLYDIHIMREPGLRNFSVQIAPTHQPELRVITDDRSRKTVISLLREHDHFAKFAAVEYVDRVELGKHQPLLEQWLSDKDAAAFGWTSELRET